MKSVLNLGAGSDIHHDAVNVDHLDLPGIDVVHDLSITPWPLPDSEFTEVIARDIVEHLPSHTQNRKPSVVAFVEECHRVMAPGGTLRIQTPRHDAAFMWIDPTHVRGFTEESFDFFDPGRPFGRTTGFYSPAKFTVTCETLRNRNLRFTLVRIP